MTVLQEEETWKNRLKHDMLSPAEKFSFAEFALTKVSRTFALNIRILPSPLRNHVLYAYLYCRMADTVEDDQLLNPAEKIRLLKAFAALFTRAGTGCAGETAKAMREFPSQLPKAWRYSSQWEYLLLAHAHVTLLTFLDFPDPVREVIGHCVDEMCSGMTDFTAKHAQIGGHNIIETVEDLDKYCYYVAGTVGVMLCELFIRHSGRIHGQRAQSIRSLCVSFGLGLQLTNILKDLHDDSERNVSWLPEELLIREHLTFPDFLRPGSSGGRRRIYRTLFAKAKKHLEDALEYSCLIPRFDRRLRLFCLWPLFMAAETLAMLAESTEALTQGVRLKIPRRKVESIVRRTKLFCWSNCWIHAEFRKPMRRLESAMQALAIS